LVRPEKVDTSDFFCVFSKKIILNGMSDHVVTTGLLQLQVTLVQERIGKGMSYTDLLQQYPEISGRARLSFIFQQTAFGYSIATQS
jgi:hypothetical protein